MNRIEKELNEGSNGNRRSAELEQEIEVTKSRLDQTVDELAGKLDPREHMHTFIDWMKDQVASADPEVIKDYGSKAAGYAKENPVPFALGALTLASLFMPRPKLSGRSSNTTGRSEAFMTHPTASPYEQRASDWEDTLGTAQQSDSKVDQLKDSAGETWNQMKDSIVERKDRVENSVSRGLSRTGETVQSAAETARVRASEIADQTKERVERGKDEYPVCMGVGAFALGLLAAITMPRTRRENDLMGETSDQTINQVVQGAKDKLRDEELTLDQLQEKTDAAIEDAAERVEEKISS